MSVTQISQVQVRRGLLQDLGQLTAGEFGWAVDELRLFIGNGPVTEGAPYEGITEVITKKTLLDFYTGSGTSGLTGLLTFPYTFKGTEGGYQVETGLSAGSPVTRLLQNKLDDIINVKDFGATGDGLTNDFAALQRAFNQVYNRQTNSIPPSTRRVINFSPGTYIIENELVIPPYCVLRAGGRGSVIIRQINSASTCIFRLANSAGNYNNTVVNGVAPGQVEIQGIRFEITSSNDRIIGLIESATNVIFSQCQFVGTRVLPTTSINTQCIQISSNFLSSSNIKFINCDFSGTDTAVTIIDNFNINNIVFDTCTFYSHIQGIVAQTNRSRSFMGLRVINSVFNKIKERALTTMTNVTGVTSLTNSYLDVGTNYGITVANVSTIDSTSVTSSVIKFAGDSSYSFGDLFFRPYDKENDIPTVEHASAEAITIDSSNGIKLGSRYQTIGKSYILPYGNTSFIAIPARLLSGVIHYNIERLQRFRSGIITYTVDTISNNVHFRESYTQVTATDVQINMSYIAIPGLGSTKRPTILLKVMTNIYGDCVFTFDVKSQDYKTFLDSTQQTPALSVFF